ASTTTRASTSGGAPGCERPEEARAESAAALRHRLHRDPARAERGEIERLLAFHRAGPRVRRDHEQPADERLECGLRPARVEILEPAFAGQPGGLLPGLG